VKRLLILTILFCGGCAVQRPTRPIVTGMGLTYITIECQEGRHLVLNGDSVKDRLISRCVPDEKATSSDTNCTDENGHCSIMIPDRRVSATKVTQPVYLLSRERPYEGCRYFADINPRSEVKTWACPPKEAK
jgi:hypothetical protein